MIKRILIGLSVVLVLLLALPFVTLGPKGHALLQLSDLAEPGVVLAKLKRWRNPLTGERVSEPEQFYKWQDKAGRWHYGSSPPAQGTSAEVLSIDSNSNVIPPLVDEAKE